MKIRVTLMTENDKHVASEVTDLKIEEMAERVWEETCDMFAKTGDKIAVEKIELIER